MKPLLAVVLAVLLASCAPAEEVGRIVLALDPGSPLGPTADPGTPMLDDEGLADLARYPLFLVLSVHADDLASPVVATWPTTVPDGPRTEVEIDVAVEPGARRSLALELILADDEGQATTFLSPAPGSSPEMVDVVAGRTTEVELVPVELPTATVRAVIPAGSGVDAVAWVDDRAGAALPPTVVDGGLAVTSLAVGRTYWPRVVTSDGATTSLDRQTVRPDTEGAVLTVTLELD